MCCRAETDYSWAADHRSLTRRWEAFFLTFPSFVTKPSDPDIVFMGGRNELLRQPITRLGFALRQLRASLVFTRTALIVLAIGMAASVASFAFIDAAFDQPLPYQNPSRLVGVFGRISVFLQSNLSYPDYIDLKKPLAFLIRTLAPALKGLTLCTMFGFSE